MIEGGGGGGGGLSWTVTIMYVLIYDWSRRGGGTIMNSNYHVCTDLWLKGGGGGTIMNSNYHVCTDLWLIEGGGGGETIMNSNYHVCTDLWLIEEGGWLSWTVTIMHVLIYDWSRRGGGGDYHEQ